MRPSRNFGGLLGLLCFLGALAPLGAQTASQPKRGPARKPAPSASQPKPKPKTKHYLFSWPVRVSSVQGLQFYGASLGKGRWIEEDLILSWLKGNPKRLAESKTRGQRWIEGRRRAAAKAAKTQKIDPFQLADLPRIELALARVEAYEAALEAVREKAPRLLADPEIESLLRWIPYFESRRVEGLGPAWARSYLARPLSVLARARKDFPALAWLELVLSRDFPPWKEPRPQGGFFRTPKARWSALSGRVQAFDTWKKALFSVPGFRADFGFFDAWIPLEAAELARAGVEFWLSEEDPPASFFEVLGRLSPQTTRMAREARIPKPQALLEGLVDEAARAQVRAALSHPRDPVALAWLKDWTRFSELSPAKRDALSGRVLGVSASEIEKRRGDRKNQRLYPAQAAKARLQIAEDRAQRKKVLKRKKP